MRRDSRSDSAQLYRKWYNSARWRALRAQRLAQDPLCAMCLAAGDTVAATVCDHIKEHKGNVELFYSYENTQALCALHHSSTKQAEERGIARQLIGADGWPV